MENVLHQNNDMKSIINNIELNFQYLERFEIQIRQRSINPSNFSVKVTLILPRNNWEIYKMFSVIPSTIEDAIKEGIKGCDQFLSDDPLDSRQFHNAGRDDLPF